MTDDNLQPEDMAAMDLPENTISKPEAEAPAFSAEALETVGKISGSILNAAASTLGVTLNTTITVSTLSETAHGTFQEFSEPFANEEKFLILVEYQKSFSGTLGYILREHDAKILADLMLGGTGEVTPAPLSDMQMGAIGEAMSQMMNSAATCMATTIAQVVDVRSPDVIPYDPDFLLAALPGVGEGSFLATHYQFQIQSAGTSISLIQLIAAPEVQKLFTVSHAAASPPTPVKTPAITDLQDVLSSLQWEPETTPVATVASQARVAESKAEGAGAGSNYASAPQTNTGFPPSGAPGGFYGGPPQQPASGYQGASNHPHPGSTVTVQSAQFAPFDQSLSAYGDQNRNLELVMDVTLNLTVELGKTNLSIKEVLELTRGSVIELNRIAGEPVDLLANGKLIAKGEVVVIEDNFGIRITTIISPSERLRGL